MKHKIKRIIDFLEVADLTSLDAAVWSRDDEDDPLWEGPIWNMPWWVAQAKIDYKADNDIGKPIDYREHLKSGRAGFVIWVK
jgi:hypothetical protein